MNSGMLPQELLNIVAEIASNTAISYYKEEVKKAEKKKKSNRIKEVKRQLEGYRRIVRQIDVEQNFTEDEKAELRWKFVEDLVGNTSELMSKSERIIKDEEKRRQETMYSIYRIENALKLYKEECDKSSSEEERRRYRAIYAMYIGEEAMNIPEIAEKENVSEKTVYRDLGIAYSILSIYLFGV